MYISGLVENYVVVQDPCNNITSLKDCMCEMNYTAVLINSNNIYLHYIKVSYLPELLNMSSFREDESRTIYVVQIN
jgi:hypothetical protein